VIILLNICAINVGVSVGNCAVVCQVFSFVDVFFIIDPPVDGLGDYVEGEVGSFTCISGLARCDIQVYIRHGFVGLFDVVWVDASGVVLSVVSDGVCRRIGGVYLRPELGVSKVVEYLGPYRACDILIGDLNGRHDRWGYVADVCGHNSQGRAVSRELEDLHFMVPSTPTHDGVSVIDLCAFRRPPRKYRTSHRAGLPHAAQIIKIPADTDILPAYKRARWDKIEEAL